ncbi:MAG: hypothetical protein NTY48_04540 [Candidatus Diapherotrites archaeon]|nr:hypothetical protein [Candidatus Diapherotrites archaeon]
MLDIQAQQIFANIEKLVEQPPSKYHKLGFFRISEIFTRKSQGFKYYYSHIGKAEIVDLQTARFISILKLQPRPKIFAIQSYWLPTVRQKGIKPSWGKTLLHFSFENFDNDRTRVTFHTLKK